MHITTKKTAVLFALMVGACTANSALAIDEPYDITLLEIVGEVHLDEITPEGQRLAVIHKAFEWDPSNLEVTPEPPRDPVIFQGSANASTSQSFADGAWLSAGAGGHFSETWYPSYSRFESISLYLTSSATCDIGLPVGVGHYNRAEGRAWSLHRFQIDLREEMIVDLTLKTGSRDGNVSSVHFEWLQDQRWSQLIFEDQTRGETFELNATGDTASERETHYRVLKPGKYLITMYNRVEVYREDCWRVISVSPDGDFYKVRMSESGTLRMTLRKKPLTDLDGDGAVNGKDLALLLGVWNTDGFGSNESGPYTADLDVSGKVDGKDLALLLGDWDG